MALIVVIDLVVVFTLILASRRGLENALPAFCFIVVLFPNESKLVLPGLFDLSTERVALIALLVMYVSRRERLYRRPIPLKYMMLLHLGWITCSAALSLSVATSLKQVIFQGVEYYLLYYIFVQSISEMHTLYRICYAIVTALTICCVLGCLEISLHWSVLSIFPSNLWTTYYSRNDPLYVEWGRGIRVRSTFPHPILFGDALAIGSTLVLFLLCSSRKRVGRVLLGLVLALMIWTLYKTASRGPIIAASLSFLLCLMMIAPSRKYVLLCSGLFLISLVVRPGLFHTLADWYESTLNPNTLLGGSYEFRHDLNGAVIAAVAKDPTRVLFGYGLGTFRERGLDIEHLGDVRHFYTCDNHWIMFLYETGYVGLILIAVLLLKPLILTFSNFYRLPRPDNYLSGVFFIALAGFYFSLLSVAGYNWGQQGFIAWILIASAMAYPQVILRQRGSNTTVTSAQDRRPTSEQLHAVL
jgi:hypothetical protein